MNATWKTTAERRRKQRRNRRIVLIFSVVLLTALFGYYNEIFRDDYAPEPVLIEDTMPIYGSEESVQCSVSPEPSAPATPLPEPVRRWTIAPGDNLSSIFDSEKISQNILCQILAADESLLALDILRPGNILTFTVDEKTEQLVEMELFFHPAHQVIYRRIDESSFDSEEILLPGVWENELVAGEMAGSFYYSALKAGLSEQEVGNISDLFKNKINFSRDIRPGDPFQVVRSVQLVDGTPTGQSRIEGVRIFARKHSYTAFLFEDGNYYDAHGESLARAFQRYPYKGSYRVSSPFNLARVHPITGRISPHNGVDFAMPMGTPVYATGDGEVVRVKDHPFAGKYIEIQHDGRYVTRYLHLSRSTVRRGQKVSRGERIALSGNSGRSTGAHLHYELHINGRVVNPLTAKIPMSSAIPKNGLETFLHRVTELTTVMEHPTVDLVGGSLSQPQRATSFSGSSS